MVAQAMKDGAYGMSTGLIYAPGCFCETPELIALAEVVAEHRGYYVTHVRGETSVLIDAALDEALTICREAGTPLEISHMKVIGLKPHDRGYIDSIIKKVEEAREKGLEIGFDCYPYTRAVPGCHPFCPNGPMKAESPDCWTICATRPKEPGSGIHPGR